MPVSHNWQREMDILLTHNHRTGLNVLAIGHINSSDLCRHSNPALHTVPTVHRIRVGNSSSAQEKCLVCQQGCSLEKLFWRGSWRGGLQPFNGEINWLFLECVSTWMKILWWNMSIEIGLERFPITQICHQAPFSLLLFLCSFTLHEPSQQLQQCNWTCDPSPLACLEAKNKWDTETLSSVSLSLSSPRAPLMSALFYVSVSGWRGNRAQACVNLGMSLVGHRGTANSPMQD